MLAGILTLENGKWLKQNTTTYIDILKFISSSASALSRASGVPVHQP
jgi:hypothetical protein